MADADWRALARAWRTNPDDPDLLAAAIAAARRACVRLPGALLDAQTEPARTFHAPRALRVFALRADHDREQGPLEDRVGQPAHPWSSLEEVGQTPGPVALPPRHLWWLRPAGPIHGSGDVRGHVESAVSAEAGGLDLSALPFGLGDLALLAEADPLRALTFQRCHQLTDGALGALPRGLRYLDLWACGAVSSETARGMSCETPGRCAAPTRRPTTNGQR